MLVEAVADPRRCWPLGEPAKRPIPSEQTCDDRLLGKRPELTANLWLIHDTVHDALGHAPLRQSEETPHWLYEPDSMGERRPRVRIEVRNTSVVAARVAHHGIASVWPDPMRLGKSDGQTSAMLYCVSQPFISETDLYCAV